MASDDVLGFGTQTAYGESGAPGLRSRAVRDPQSKLRGMLEVCEGQRPSIPYLPVKYLPVKFKDTSLKDGVVIPKGTIVSLVPATDYTSQVCPDTVNTLLVPANGSGSTSTDSYSDTDVDLGTIALSGSTEVTVTASNKGDLSFSRAANVPVGVVTSDVYQDLEGRYLNYKLFEIWGILCDWVVEVPYIPSITSTSDDDYVALEPTGGFAYGADLVVTDFVKPDVNGKFVEGDPSTDDDVPQIVGQVIDIVKKFPRDMLDLVQSYPGLGTPGSDTSGYPAFLYNVQQLITAGATVYSARINLTLR